MSRWDPAEDEIHDVRPYDFESAKRAIARASRDQSAAEQWRAETARDFALKEEAYRIALQVEMVRLHADGVAWTATEPQAVGSEW